METKDGQTKLYLMTMGVLAVSCVVIFNIKSYSNPQKPYRSRRLGTQTLDLILASASSHLKPKISHIYLHVQISNTSAKRFYERHGFKEIGVHEDYYKKIAPHDAWILERPITSAGNTVQK
jgi:RimJ/RimL family protein N-acetyltransferase